MAAKDVAQRPLDLASTLASGQAVAATDAAHVTTNAADIQPIGPANVQGASLDAAASNHAHEGVHKIIAGVGVTIAPVSGLGDVTVNATAGTNTKEIGLSDAAQHSVLNSDGEKVIAQWNVDSSVFVNLAAVTPRLAALLAKSNALATAVATLRLYVGGTADIAVVDGTLRATATDAALATTFQQAEDASPPAAFNIGASGVGVVVKLTLQLPNGVGVAAGDSAQVRGASVVFSG